MERMIVNFATGETLIVPLMPEEVAALPLPVLPANVPHVVSARQARLALWAAGLLPTVTAAVEASTNEALKIEWEYATEFRRDNPALNSMWEALGRSQSELDELFTAAASIA